MSTRQLNVDGVNYTLFTEQERWAFLKNRLKASYQEKDPDTVLDLMTNHELNEFARSFSLKRNLRYIEDLRQTESTHAKNLLEEEMANYQVTSERRFLQELVNEDLNELFAGENDPVEELKAIIYTNGWDDYAAIVDEILPTIDLDKKTKKWVDLYLTYAELISVDEKTEVATTIGGTQYYGYLLD